ncbi:MAG: glycoside hydrolase family 31 protein [Acidobacteriia bacterium]|nr:glycoside hydrolase family 31 protein [Terriglobia bacterium]
MVRISRTSVALIFCTLSLATFVPRFAAAAEVPAPTARKEADGVTFRFAETVMKLQVYSDRIIRVVCAPGTTLPELKSLSVIAKPATVRWTYKETSNDFGLATDAIQARVDRKTGAVTFYDRSGSPYLAEVDGGGKSFGPTPVKNLTAYQVRQEFNLAPSQSIFGLGQHQTGAWDYRGTTVHLMQSNTNIAIPVLISSRGYGVLWDNPAITDVEVGITGKENVLAWMSEAGRAIDYYFLAGPSIDEVVADYRQLTGDAPMFGKWAFGFWQCRERYKTQEELLGVADEYRRLQIPIDGIIQDWQYWSPAPWGSHVFDPSRYPDPAGMVKQLHENNFHLIISVWPRFEAGSEHYKQLEAVNGLFAPVFPNVFPEGKGKWYDAFNAKARQIYWQQISDTLFKIGIDGWWLDATEPELGGKWGEIRDLRTADGSGALVANAYPLMTTTAVYQGQRAESSAKRVFILTRSAYSGQQRNAAVCWSGDIRGDWATFRKQLSAGLNFSLSGIPYWNTDIGGFFGGSVDDPKYRELFTRWFQFGTFCPMFRVHGTGDSKEMWRFGPETEATLVKFDRLRYRLLPYIYTVAWQVTTARDTMMRPLVMDFRTDPQAVKVSDQFMFGRAMLVNPVATPGTTSRKVYLPAGGDWYDFWTGRLVPGGQTIDANAPLDTMPMFIKAGTILPMGPEIKYAMESQASPMELRVYRGKDGTFALYEDAGDGYNYETGEYAEIPITWNEAKGILTVGARRGSYPGMPKEREFHVVWVREGKGVGVPQEKAIDATVSYKGAAVEVPAP